MHTPILIQPQPGPQTTFSSCPADIAFFGGQAGGGKSHALLMEAARWFTVENYAGVIFRRTLTDIKKSGGLWSKARSMYALMGARLREGAELDATWEDTHATVQFRGLEAESDVEDWQGAELDMVGLDEATHFTEYQFWYLVSRLRSTTGIKPYIRCTCNPDPDSWVRNLIDWWIGPDGLAIPERAGVIRWICRNGDAVLNFASREDCQKWLDSVGDKDGQPKSLTFIPSKLEDNPALLKVDPNYRGNLALQDAVTRARLLGANWNARAHAGALFNRSWFEVIDTPPALSQVRMFVRGWDTAASLPTPEYPNPDWTRGCLWALLHNGKLALLDIVSIRDAPGAVDALIMNTAKQDGPRVLQAFWQDPASAGVFQIEHFKRQVPINCEVSVEIERQNKLVYASAWSARIDPRERMHQTQAYIVRAPWNNGFFSEIEAFSESALKDKNVKKDQVDACSRAYLEIEKVKTGFWGRMSDALDRMTI